MAATDTAALAAELTAALAGAGRTLDDLTATEAVEVAENLRAVVGVLATPSPLDVRLAADLSAAADLIEQHAGIG